MDFTGRLNFTYPQIAEKDSPERKAFDFSRINRPTTIRDARSIFGLEAEASDATELLTDGIGQTSGLHADSQHGQIPNSLEPPIPAGIAVKGPPCMKQKVHLSTTTYFC